MRSANKKGVYLERGVYLDLYGLMAGECFILIRLNLKKILNSKASSDS